MDELLKKYKGINVLVTGGAGFIGSHLVEKLLSLGANVIVIDTMLCGNKIAHLMKKKILSVHKLDITDEKAIAPLFKDVHMVFHLAAVVGVEETQLDHLNLLNVEIIGTANVIKLAAKNKVRRFVFASSSEVYGDSLKPMAESGPFSPKSTYALTKMVGEHYCMAYYQKYKLKYTSLRYFNTYGPRQDDRFVISRFVDRAIRGKEITIYGDGNQTRDFTFVEDSVNMSLLAAISDKGSCQALNIGTNKAVSINTLSDLILKTLKMKSKVKVVYKDYDVLRSREIEIFNRLANVNKTKKLLNYSAATPLQSGLKICIDWYLNKR